MIALRLRKQDAIGHELDPRIATEHFLEADLIADVSAKRHGEFLRHPLRYARRRNSPWLGAADQSPALSQRLRHHLRQLRGFPRTGVAHHHDHLMLANRGHDLVVVLHHREFLGIIPSS